MPQFSLRLGAFLLLALLAAPAGAQTQTVLFPGQSGAELRASIRAAYRPSSYGTNDDLYSVVDRTTVAGQSGVVCVYTGYFVPFDGVPNNDPSQDVFNNGAGINQEHTWPQSLLPNDGAKSDLHNLFPSQVGVNSDRGNFAFDEITDTQTTRWYRGIPPYTQTSIPSANIDEYSEILSGSRFEPREDHKGNVARALFYMRTVYDTQTNGSFPFNAAQQQTYYRWHYQDAITQADQERSARVATFQNGKNNPFDLDSTLIRRAYFPGITVADEDGVSLATTSLRVVGANPFSAEARLEVRLAEAAPVRAEAFDALGRRVAVLFDGAASAGTLPLALSGRSLAPGVYAVRVAVGRDVLTQRLVRAR